ncbi:MAG: hypothetical protein R3320_00045 [Nitriliruptorales bacterium]|nr:hypothetical protein [Nitriliruptorales bacterium]
MTTTRYRSWRLLALVGVLAFLLGACSDDGGGDEPADDTTETTTEGAAATTTLTVVADTVSGPLNLPEDGSQGAVCVLRSRFPRNSEIVWRARVIDGTGEELDDTALESVVVRLADGQEFEMRYGPHPPDNATDFFWTSSFDIPEDYPTGTLDYEIVATSTDGTTGSFTPFNVAPSLLTITDEVLETIEETEA